MKKQPVPIFKGTPNNGCMSINNVGQWSRYLHTLNGVECEITVRKYKKKRSGKQNNYYWGVVLVILGEHFGYDVDEMHSALGVEFLTVSEEGKPDRIRSTTDLDTGEFNEYLEAVKMWAAQKFNVFIPDPEKVDI